MAEEDDTKFTKLFVGGIPYHTDDATMRQYFLQFDDIVEAVIIREKSSQRSKGYGFVSYLLALTHYRPSFHTLNPTIIERPFISVD